MPIPPNPDEATLELFLRICLEGEPRELRSYDRDRFRTKFLEAAIRTYRKIAEDVEAYVVDKGHTWNTIIQPFNKIRDALGDKFHKESDYGRVAILGEIVGVWLVLINIALTYDAFPNFGHYFIEQSREWILKGTREGIRRGLANFFTDSKNTNGLRELAQLIRKLGQRGDFDREKEEFVSDMAAALISEESAPSPPESDHGPSAASRLDLDFDR